ncbi:MAG: hypothetical protein NWF03_03495 [Candidatus Bathyarchaeota archaeon]|nr:hypothetical protein [Candidatus Bathyarchaeota archaeon]
MTGDCCCGGGDCHTHGHNHGPRRVLTKEEKIAKLKNYAEELKKELAAVEEHIEELSK